jgi:type IV pilus assembly protein PilM
MASAQKVVTVDLGTSTLKVGEFAVARGGALTLLRFGVTELGLDPNKEEDRGPHITEALTELFKAQGVRGRDVLLCVSGQSVFIKFIKLPPIAADQVEQVVVFEAQQNVPFPINEVTWDYQIMPNRGAGAEAEAVIVAIKKDVLEAEVAAVEAAGVRIKQVDVAPFALLNAFRYSQAQNEDCALIIDMGARTTNLIFAEKNNFWIRNVPIAGNQISQSICNEMQEPFASAETLKKGKGFVSLGGVYADPEDADAARISKLIRSTMTRLHVDINRSIAHYRSTLGGTAPKRVFLTGGSSQLPYLDLFIADKLSLPVEFFNPLRNVNLAPQVNTAQLQTNNCYTGELVGLALRRAGSCPAEITLDAPTLRARANKKRKQPYFYAGLVAWILMFVCIALYYWQQINLTRGTADQLRNETGSLQTYSGDIEKLSVENDNLQQTIDLAVRLGNQRNAWPAVLDALNAKMPPGVWITQLTPAFDPRGATSSGAGDQRRPGGPGGNRPNRPGGPNASFELNPGAARAPGLAGYEPPTTQINVLVINGLYHADEKTTQVGYTQLSELVAALAEIPIFDIDKSKTSETLVSFETPETNPGYFAQGFSMHLKLKQPIELTP